MEHSWANSKGPYPIGTTLKKQMILTFIISAAIAGFFLYTRPRYETVIFENGIIELGKTRAGDLVTLGFVPTDIELYEHVMAQIVQNNSFISTMVLPYGAGHTDPGISFAKDGVHFSIYVVNRGNLPIPFHECMIFRINVRMRDNAEPFILFGKRFEPGMFRDDIVALLDDYTIVETDSPNRVDFTKANHAILATFNENNSFAGLSVGPATPSNVVSINHRDTSYDDYIFLLLGLAALAVIRGWIHLIREKLTKGA